MSQSFCFKRMSEESSSIVKCYIFPSLIAVDKDELCWSNGEYTCLYQRAHESDHSREWVVCGDEREIGCLVLKYVDFENQNVMVSARIFSDSKGGPSRDRARSFLLAIVEFVFQCFDLTKIYGCMDEDNPYCDLLKELGFILEGRLSQHFFKKGGFIDQLIFAIYSPRRNADA